MGGGGEEGRGGAVNVGLSRAPIVDVEVVTRPTALADDAAERAVLGAILFDAARVVPIVSALLVAADFAEPRHATLWDAFLTIHARGEPVDILTACAELRTRNRLNTIGGAQYLGELTDEMPTSAHCESHARIVVEASRRRRLAVIGERLMLAAGDSTRDGEKLRDAAVEALRALRFGRGSTASSALDLVDALMGDIERSVAGERGPTPLAFGVPTLDRMSGGGMKRGGSYFIAARPGIGKAQPLDALVLTPFGFMPMGMLRVGDVVTGRNGKPCRVTGVFPQGVKPVFRVTTGDGASTECCDEHLWFTQTRRERRRRAAGSVKSLGEIRRTLKTEHGTRINHHIPTVLPVEFACRGPLPVHPYLLGLLLGDGSMTGNCVMLTNTETDIRDRFRALLPESDCAVDADEITLRVKRKQRNNDRSDLAKAIAAMGLGVDCYGKFIPQEYLLASVADRIELLRGLFDTDGHVNSKGKSVEFTTSSERMAADVAHLIRSLGGVVSVVQRLPSFTVDGVRRVSSAVSHRMVVCFQNQVVPVSSAKHLARWLSRDSRTVGRHIEAIEPVGEKECQCISVDADDRLYVTDGFIVTHNTALACQIGGATASGGECVLYVALEPSRGEIMSATIANRAGVDLVKLTRAQHTLTQDDLDDVTTAANAVSSWPLYVVDATERETPDTVARIEAVMRALPRMPSLVVIDHLLKLQPTRRHERAHEGTGEVVAGLVSLGKRTGATMLTLCHIGRGVSGRDGLYRRPRAEDIAGGDAMNRDADGILVMHREDKYPTSKENVENPNIAGIVDLLAPKLRGVEDNTFGRMRFRGAVQRFEDMVSPTPAPVAPVRRGGWRDPNEDIDEPRASGVQAAGHGRAPWEADDAAE